LNWIVRSVVKIGVEVIRILVREEEIFVLLVERSRKGLVI